MKVRYTYMYTFVHMVCAEEWLIFFSACIHEIIVKSEWMDVICIEKGKGIVLFQYCNASHSSNNGKTRRKKKSTGENKWL